MPDVEKGGQNAEASQKEFAHELEPVGYIIKSPRESYVVRGVIAYGAFGDVYKVAGNERVYALRVELKSSPAQVKNIKTLKQLFETLRREPNHCRKHFPHLYDVGVYEKGYFMVLTELGPTIPEVRTILGKNFSIDTACYVCVHMLRAIYDLHRLGFVHRNLRPDCFRIGWATLGARKNVVLASAAHIKRVMFGDTRRLIRCPILNRTLTFIPLANFHKTFYSRKDDLESWVYCCFDIFKQGVLPWKGSKMELSIKRDFCQNISSRYVSEPIEKGYVPYEMCYLVTYIGKLKAFDFIEYDYIREVVKKTIPKTHKFLFPKQPEWIRAPFENRKAPERKFPRLVQLGKEVIEGDENARLQNSDTSLQIENFEGRTWGNTVDNTEATQDLATKSDRPPLKRVLKKTSVTNLKLKRAPIELRTEETMMDKSSRRTAARTTSRTKT